MARRKGPVGDSAGAKSWQPSLSSATELTVIRVGAIRKVPKRDSLPMTPRRPEAGSLSQPL